jgi:hypothetical protein
LPHILLYYIKSWRQEPAYIERKLAFFIKSAGLYSLRASHIVRQRIYLRAYYIKWHFALIRKHSTHCWATAVTAEPLPDACYRAVVNAPVPPARSHSCHRYRK